MDEINLEINAVRKNKIPDNVDLNPAEARGALARMIMKLFSLWNLSGAVQLVLLGYGMNGQAVLARFAVNEPFPENQDLLDRVSRLLTVHKLLGLLYPYNENIRYGWVNCRNKAFDGKTPLDIMKERGLAGMNLICHYLDSL